MMFPKKILKANDAITVPSFKNIIPEISSN